MSHFKTCILILALFVSLNKSIAQEVSTSQDTPTEENTGADTHLVDNELSLQPDSVKVMKESKQFAYAKHLDSMLNKMQEEELSRNKTPAGEPSWLSALFNSVFIKILFWSVAILFVLFILYRLFLADGFLQRQTTRSPVQEIKADEENLSLSKDYQALIDRAVMQKDFRMAVRFQFLRLLQKLAAAKHIQFAADKTNHQYIMETATKPFNQDLIRLTHQYEFVWYGGFPIEEQRFGEIQNSFNQLNEQIR